VNDGRADLQAALDRHLSQRERLDVFHAVQFKGVQIMLRSSLSRRAIVKTLTLGAAAAALAAREAEGAGEPKLDPKDPRAAAVGYVEDAAQADVKKFPSFVKGSNCENCLQLQGSAGNSYRPCSIFPGKVVAIAGWCSAWTAEM
jgi:hypothetical protein